MFCYVTLRHLFRHLRKELPAPYSKEYNKQDTDIVTLVDVDFAEYRKKQKS